MSTNYSLHLGKTFAAGDRRLGFMPAVGMQEVPTARFRGANPKVWSPPGSTTILVPESSSKVEDEYGAEISWLAFLEMISRVDTVDTSGMGRWFS